MKTTPVRHCHKKHQHHVSPRHIRILATHSLVAWILYAGNMLAGFEKYVFSIIHIQGRARNLGPTNLQIQCNWSIALILW